MKFRKVLCVLTALAMLTAASACSAGSETAEAPAPSKSGGTLYGMGVADGNPGDNAEAPLPDTAKSTDSEKAETTADSEKKGFSVVEGAAEDTNGITYSDSADMADGTEGFAAAAAADDTVKSFGDSEYTSQQPPQAGLLTAGEWKDNENWGFFTNLVNSDTISFPSFGIDPRFRTAVTVKSGNGSPVVNAKARLLDVNGNVIWSSVTDKKGIAYLFSSENTEAASVEVESEGKKQTAEISAKSDSQQNTKKTDSNDIEITLDSEGKRNPKTEIMFIVDATGSMADEMLFLQSEFSAIAKEIGTQDTKYSVNFYRDEGDDYVTKCYDFTDDITDLQSKLNSEKADGGGDIPEAVAEILKKTITEGNWSDDTVKLAFLIFDAPPHSGTEETLLAAAKAASEKGIRIIPVVSSNSERSTELFARALAITTGGTYVFLTDDSGIGDSHLEPIIGDYQVEKLYELMIRVIKEYQQ